MFGKRLFQVGALVFSVTLVGTYVYLYSRGTTAPRLQLRQVEGVSEVTPAIAAVDRPPLTIRLDSEEPDNFIRSTKSFIVFPPSSTTPLGSPSPNVEVIDLPKGQHASKNTTVIPKEDNRDVFFSSSKSAPIFDSSAIPSQSAPSKPAQPKSAQSKSDWVPYVPPEIPRTNQPPIRK